jgi:branched-chain amino acid aminotransferase
MNECFNQWFLENGVEKLKAEFKDDYLRKGKSIYEVIRIIDGVPLFLEEHLARFRNSIDLIKEKMLLNIEEIKSNIVKLLELNKTYEGNIKIVFNFTENDNKTIFFFIKHSYPTQEDYESGVNTILYYGERKNPNAKVINASFRENVEKAIREANSYEAILVNNEGFITEGSKSNIFLVIKDVVYTSPVEAVLPGITREMVMGIIKNVGIKYSEKRISIEDLKTVEGLFITGTSPQVLPIKKVDELEFKSSNNDIIRRIMREYENKVNNYITLNKV